MGLSGRARLAKEGAHIILHLRVQPGASREGVLGLHGDRIRIGVHARAKEGAANRSVLRLLSRTLRISRSCLSIVSGERSRDKDILITSELAEKDVLARLGLPADG